MSAAGRKRKEGPRTASGRLSRAARAVTEPASPAQVRRLRDAALAKMLDPQWGTELGRQFLAGHFGAVEYAAGRKYWLLREAYEGRRHGGADRTFQQSVDVFAALSDARSVLMGSGYRIWSVFRRVVERDQFTPGTAEAMNLKAALRVLVDHWRMEG